MFDTGCCGMMQRDVVSCNVCTDNTTSPASYKLTTEECNCTQYSTVLDSALMPRGAFETAAYR